MPWRLELVSYEYLNKICTYFCRKEFVTFNQHRFTERQVSIDKFSQRCIYRKSYTIPVCSVLLRIHWHGRGVHLFLYDHLHRCVYGVLRPQRSKEPACVFLPASQTKVTIRYVKLSSVAPSLKLCQSYHIPITSNRLNVDTGQISVG